VILVKWEPANESWRVYTNRLAKLNNTTRRRILKWLRRRDR